MSWQRLYNDFQFAILFLLGGTAAVGVLPFLVYRFLTGQFIAGGIDVAIIACISAALGYAWRGGRLDRASLAVVGACALGCVSITWFAGLAGIVWTYPVVVGSFLLVARWQAAIASVVTVAANVMIALYRAVLEAGLPLAMFLVTGFVTGLFALAFAQRTGEQRRRLEELATRDPLTGAQNRRAMNRELQLAVEAKARHDANFALALFDIDHFKQINDTYGHEAGDQVLIDFVELLRNNTRKLDQLYRTGGEEFLLLLAAADADALPGICDTLHAVLQAGLRCRDKAVTASIGGAALLPGEDYTAWLARADAALYRAKRNGRNRVELAGTEPIPVRMSGIEPGSSSLDQR